MKLTLSAHLNTDSKVKLYRCKTYNAPMMTIGEVDQDLTIFFYDDATARRFAEAILGALPRKENEPDDGR